MFWVYNVRYQTSNVRHMHKWARLLCFFFKHNKILTVQNCRNGAVSSICMRSTRILSKQLLRSISLPNSPYCFLGYQQKCFGYHKASRSWLSFGIPEALRNLCSSWLLKASNILPSSPLDLHLVKSCRTFLLIKFYCSSKSIFATSYVIQSHVFLKYLYAVNLLMVLNFFSYTTKITFQVCLKHVQNAF